MKNYSQCLEMLQSKLEETGCNDTEKKMDQFDSYMKGILEWNEKVNLTAIKDPSLFIREHYIDSLLPVGKVLVSGREIFETDIFSDAGTVIDVGTGGGFPGVPLAIVFPDIEFVLLDSTKKRLKIVEQLCGICGINNIRVEHMRAEEAGHDPSFREQFDICVSRAVARLPVLCEYCLPLIKKGGKFLAYKGSGAGEELKDSKRAVSVLGGKYIGSVNSPFSDDERSVILIEKISNTSEKYPRGGGKPSKSPL